MRILGVETSCDETALSIVEASGDINNLSFKLENSVLLSQTDIHKQYGGVFPAIAKREHAKAITPLLQKLLRESSLEQKGETVFDKDKIKKILEREQDLYESFIKYVSNIKKPDIDAISVTYGPGLEPALWVGINFAKALGQIWNIPVIPTNHMEGHIISPFLSHNPKEIIFPAIALLISGGHTEIVMIESWGQYKILGKTRDDAIGEAFDKVARLLNLSYPGGPKISRLAKQARDNNYENFYILPRPMLHSPDYDFSFSGIKTAVLYALRDKPAINEVMQADLAREFENAVTEILIKKAKKVLENYPIRSVIIGGGVIANEYIKDNFNKLVSDHKDIALYMPTRELSTDNATMIAMAGYIKYLEGDKNLSHTDFKASGNASVANLL